VGETELVGSSLGIAMLAQRKQQEARFQQRPSPAPKVLSLIKKCICKVLLEQGLLIWEFLPGQICSVQRDSPGSWQTPLLPYSNKWSYWALVFSRPKSKQIHLLFSFTEGSGRGGSGFFLFFCFFFF